MAERFEIVYGFIPRLQMGAAAVDNVPVYVRKFFNDQEKDRSDT
ncbi:MAG: hypothetical protein WKF84_08090 [Pyrinomonadaceae bacterium]